jgi:hypothetical protein
MDASENQLMISQTGITACPQQIAQILNCATTPWLKKFLFGESGRRS